jgi:uncharacterized membrane protein required for colicin V production
MNWLDLVIIAVLAVAAFMGMRTGLIGAVIAAAGAFIGWLIASQVSDKVGGMFDDSLAGDTWVTVAAYVVIIVIALVVSGFVGKIIRPVLSVATLGLSSMVDRLGGIALGLVLGLAISGALILVLARFAYDFNLPEEGIAGQVTERIPNVEETRESVETALGDSSLVGVFVDIADAIPGSTLGFVPSDFKTALDILEERTSEPE